MKKYKIKYMLLNSIELQQIIVKNCNNKFEAIGKLMRYKKTYIMIKDVSEVMQDDIVKDLFDIFK